MQLPWDQKFLVDLTGVFSLERYYVHEEQNYKRPLVNHGSRTRGLNMAQIVHVSSVGMFQCIYFQKRDHTSGGLAFTLE